MIFTQSYPLFLPVGREIIDYLEGAPGIEDEFMLDFLLTMAESGDYLTIIWDTAPTVTTLNLLFVQQMFYSHLTQAHKLYFKVKKVFKQGRSAGADKQMACLDGTDNRTSSNRHLCVGGC